MNPAQIVPVLVGLLGLTDNLLVFVEQAVVALLASGLLGVRRARRSSLEDSTRWKLAKALVRGHPRPDQEAGLASTGDSLKLRRLP